MVRIMFQVLYIADLEFMGMCICLNIYQDIVLVQWETSGYYNSDSRKHLLRKYDMYMYMYYIHLVTQ